MRVRPIILGLLAAGAPAALAVTPDPDAALATYNVGDSVPVSCLNRTIDNGEHVLDATTGKLQYIPFATCNSSLLSTSPGPLTLSFGRDGPLNCTIPEVTDEMYHLLEFYVHHDSPLSCRIPARPLGSEGAISSSITAGGQDAGEVWVPLTFALTGKLELSHLHIATRLNLVVHVSNEGKGRGAGGVIEAAAAYSTTPMREAMKIIIGDPLPLQFSVRWYKGSELPKAVRITGDGAGFHVFCGVLGALVGAGVCYAWTVGVDLPRRLKRMTIGMKGRGGEGLGIIGNFDAGGKGGRGGYGFPGNGVGNGNGRGGYGYGVGLGMGGGKGGGKRKD